MAAIIFKCPNCGGDLRFEPEKQTFQCEYCLSEFSEEQMNQSAFGQKDETGQPEKEMSPEESVGVYSCPSCGAQIVADETTAATFCYYCHNPVVLTGKMKGEYHPDGVLPFEIDRERALEIFEKWIGGKKYIPEEFYSQDQIEKLTGVYFPYWLYGCQVEGKLEAEGTKQKASVSGNMRIIQTEQYAILRNGTMEIENVTRNALSKANKKLVEGVMPFEMKKLQSFQMGYLSGFLAENRDVGQERFTTEVEKEIKGFAENSLKSQVSGYDSVQIRSKDLRIVDPQWRYVLMPVWTLTYVDKKRDKVYYFACNGQTGKVCGELPVDSGRLARLFATIFVPLFAVLLIVGYFL
ncbi:MAG: TFIIB-type zinc ribbon-containing protein [Lachnospiraceae bacterium]|jgi:DNA-directed RNA polymerase subunit RPC12/RpoP|nr:TFIIB-type zinc ribbon-containing protein [Lachnospiraceae bacterium]